MTSSNAAQSPPSPSDRPLLPITADDGALHNTTSLPSSSSTASSSAFTSPAALSAEAATAATRVMDVYETRPVTRYEKISKIGEGTYGTVCQ